MLASKNVFVGSQNRDAIQSSRNKELITWFNLTCFEAYVTCADYLRKKLPLENKTIKLFSMIDPTVRGHHMTVSSLKHLAVLVPVPFDHEELDR